MKYYVETSQYFTDKNQHLYFKCRKNGGRARIKSETFRVAVYRWESYKIVWLHVVVFTKHDFLYFWGNVHLLKYYPVKVPQNCLNSFN